MSSFRLILLLLFCSVMTGSAYELRVWEDTDGNRFEGRFLRELFGKLTIEGEDGSTQTFELEKLSELDQRYLRVKVPPKIEVEIKIKSSSVAPRQMATVREVSYEDYQAAIVITKKSQRPFTSRLKAEIFLVAKEVEGSNYILLDRTEREFLMPTVSKGSELELKSRIVRTTKFRDLMAGEMKGEEFAGSLAVISSMEGEIVLVETTLSPSWFKDPQVINNLRELSITGAPSIRSRHFDKTGKKVPPPRSAHRGPAAQ